MAPDCNTILIFIAGLVVGGCVVYAYKVQRPRHYIRKALALVGADGKDSLIQLYLEMACGCTANEAVRAVYGKNVPQYVDKGESNE